MAADTSADIAALQAADQAFVKAFNSTNADAIAALYDRTRCCSRRMRQRRMDGRQSRGFLKNEMDGAKKGGVTFNLVGKPAGGVSGEMGWQSGAYNVTDKSGKVVESGNTFRFRRRRTASGSTFVIRGMPTPHRHRPPAPARAPAPPKK
jgi:hypothetical protein